MSQTIGKQLKEARLKQGQSTEDIAHETRIPESTLCHLEEDDYSHFANPTYARSFLGIYSEYLEVDASDVIEAMQGPKTNTLDSGYLKPKITMAPPNTTIPIHKNLVEQRRGHPLAMLLLMILLVFLIPTVYFLAKNAGAHEERMRITEETEEPPAAADIPPAEPDSATPDENQAPVANQNDAINEIVGVRPPANDQSNAPEPDDDALRPTVIEEPEPAPAPDEIAPADGETSGPAANNNRPPETSPTALGPTTPARPN
jgi:cytoskeletal protein RodZ